MEKLVVIFILISLSTQVLPVAIGIDPKKLPQSLIFGIILIISQLLFLLAGTLLGDRFLHLLETYQGIVIFVGFFLIGIRMLIDAFKIRKGERTYVLDNTRTIVLISVAQGINTFLGGLILTYFIIDIGQLVFTFFIVVTIFTILGTGLHVNKTSYVFSALIYTLSAFIIIISSVYLGFFQ